MQTIHEDLLNFRDGKYNFIVLKNYKTMHNINKSTLIILSERSTTEIMYYVILFE